jgi:hypothetical protein
MLIVALGFMLVILTTSAIQADFIQCPGGNCNGTDLSDVINGASVTNIIRGMDGNDVIFGGDANDDIRSNGGNNIIFGGLGTDLIITQEGNDILMIGPDAPNGTQEIQGHAGNDTMNVLVGDVSECLIFRGGLGNDTANLIGFGPYSAQHPFGQSGFDMTWVHVVDPVAGGDIYIRIVENTNFGTETINGLSSPNVTIVNDFDCPELPFGS